jgi:hypothetical protein
VGCYHRDQAPRKEVWLAPHRSIELTIAVAPATGLVGGVTRVPPRLAAAA